MGASVSKTSSWSSWLQNHFTGKVDTETGHNNESSSIRFTGTVLVHSRKGSMFFDEDGHLAHEFYEEIRATKAVPKATMKRISSNLRPQGEVDYDYPRLNVDFPRVIFEG